MPTQVLVSEKRYGGKYVALVSFTNNTVVASGEDPVVVVKRAEKKGISEPVIVYIPKENLAQIF